MPRTGTRRRAVGNGERLSSADPLVNRTDSWAGAAPYPPNCGPSRSGSTVSMLAFGSPIGPQAGSPDFRTSAGLAANQAGRHSTMSAMRPGCRVPTSWAIPCTSAGLIVSLAR